MQSPIFKAVNMQDRIIINFNIEGLEITNSTNKSIKSGNRNYVIARFRFTPDWNNLAKNIIISKQGVDTVRDAIIDDTYRIPNEFMEDIGNISISVTGGDRLVTGIAVINVELGGNADGAPPLPPTPTYTYITSPNGSVMQIKHENNIYYGLVDSVWVAFGTGSGGGSISDLVWIPYIDNEGVISWTIDEYDPGNPPIERNIRGPKGNDGKDGINPTIEVSPSPPDEFVLEITDVNGTFLTPNLKGQKGPKGDDGLNFDPADLSRITDLEESTEDLDNRVTILEELPPARDGVDGISPTIEVYNDEPESYILEITDARGSFLTPNLAGQNGADGESFDPADVARIDGLEEAIGYIGNALDIINRRVI